MAKRRAVSEMSRLRATANARKAREYWLPTCSVQNRAVAVWSEVRTVLSTAPSVFTWFRSSAHSGLDSESGGSERNSEGVLRVNGTILPSHGRAGAANAGGVGIQMPAVGADGQV